MNHVITPNMASIVGYEYWRDNVRREMKRQGVSQKRLASLIGMERKSINFYLTGASIPKLDVALQIYAALGYESLWCPLSRKERDKNETSSGS